MWEGRQAVSNGRTDENFAVDWFENRLNEAKIEIDGLYKDFRLSEILKTIYSLIWDDFCSWYLEWVKPGFEQPIDKSVYEKTTDFFEQLMELLHPFMPFVTEEIYHQLRERSDDLTVKQLTQPGSVKPGITSLGALLKEVITAIRDARIKAQLKPRDTIQLHILSENAAPYKSIESFLAKQVNADVAFTDATINNSITVVVGKDKFFIAAAALMDTSSQKDQLVKDLDYQKGFLASVEKKLSNERFVLNAKPEVVEVEKKKKADAEAKIKAIEESLQNL
jgi:valyl-tRNA synthetase